MAMGKRRELWDMTSAIRHTLMQCGMAKFNRVPTPHELNPLRDDEDDSDDVFSDTLDKALAQG